MLLETVSVGNKITFNFDPKSLLLQSPKSGTQILSAFYGAEPLYKHSVEAVFAIAS